ncbi:MAG: precorrin-2 C(20)-methyltransferase [Planctomycetaceae bacterium]|jgi:precorrin-2/cobalt-factor-2 C20-methyltransferase|nr:precorrin-2 C(20)-methyltransferase [Planctomycetaceae bacterium]
MNGKLYGIGTGPGDSELLTLKAIRIIRQCGVVAVPAVESNDRTAFAVVEKYLIGKRILECRFSMERDEEKRKRQRIFVADEICTVLESGTSVGFVTLGDPSVYSTYCYVDHIVSARGFETEIIPGVASYSAVAASLNIPLCEGNQPLHIIPAGCGEKIEDWIDLPGNKIIMKSGKNLRQILNMLERHGLSKQTKIVSRCTMTGQKIFETIEEFNQNGQIDQAGYFSVIFVKENKK